MGNRIFGCDDCQLYCPFNRDPETTGEEAFRPRVVDVLPTGATNDHGRQVSASSKPRGGPGVGQAGGRIPAALSDETSRLDRTSLLELFAWDEETFLRNTEGSALRRIDYERWQRNLAVALGNGPPSLKVIAALQERLPGATPMVREHLEWALARLQDASGTDCT